MACDVRMSMSAHVTMRRQERQDETTEEQPNRFPKLIIGSRVHTQLRLTATLSPTNQRAESKENSLAYTRRDCCMRSPYTTFHGVQSTAHQPNTHVVHVTLTGMRVMLFCPSFTQSRRFPHTDQFITRLRRDEPAT